MNNFLEPGRSLKIEIIVSNIETPDRTTVQLDKDRRFIESLHRLVAQLDPEGEVPPR